VRTGRQESSSPYPKRSLSILGNKVTSKEGNDRGVKLAEKSDHLVVAAKRAKARGAKGMMKMRTTKPEQLNLVFADSPQGGQAAEVPDLLGTAKVRLHKAKGKDFSGFVAGATNASSLLDAVASEFNLLRALYKVVQNKGAPGVDGQSVEAVNECHRELLPRLGRELLAGSYSPGDIRRVWIPKPGGGERGLGIPNVIDRWVQQAVLQVLEPIYEPTFHDGSHGFRRGRGASTAIARAREHLAAGFTTVVDIDLAKFFDRVNHQRLLARLAQRVRDKGVLQLIGRMLKAQVVLPDGTRMMSEEGTPQGGPLSPLLSNIVLDELDWELERRGLRFVRYADDANIFVASRRAGKRVMASLQRFLEKRLRLFINSEKSAVRRPQEVHFLGFRFCRNQAGQWTIHLSRKTAERVKTRLQEMTPRNWGQSLLACIKELNTYIKGWVAYYRLCSEEGVRNWKAMDAHVRRRLRAIVIRQKKRPRYLYRHLLSRDVPAGKAAKTAWSGRGVWPRSAQSGMHLGYRIDWFTEHLVSLTTEWYRHTLPTLVPPVSERQLPLFAQ
jgi:group II intron reverse transcriptase/maturase